MPCGASPQWSAVLGNRMVFRNRKWVILILVIAGLMFIPFLGWQSSGFGPTVDFGHEFDAARALEDVRRQVSFGPRVPGSEAHRSTVAYIQEQLELAGWTVEKQEAVEKGQALVNVIGKRPGSGAGWIILGAHYDSRFWADKDPDPELRRSPVLGANDGASGVAVLLELARVLPQSVQPEVWLVFFDAEDNGGIDDWDWILGSQAFVKALEGKPDAAVIVDMVGDRDLNIFLEQNSDLQLSLTIWKHAADLGYESYFLPLPKYRILDDHVPFARNGVVAVDIIDFDYPYHHTSEDTLDKVSGVSLEIVGKTLISWLQSVGNPVEP